MKIIVISHLYPNKAYPARGTFIRELFLNITGKAPADMLVPTVRALPFTRKWDYTHAPFLADREAERVHYLSFPHKQFPKIIQRNITAALVPRLKRESGVESRITQNSGFDPNITRGSGILAHFHWLYPDALAIPALEAAGVPTVLTIHGSDWYKTRQPGSLRFLLDECLRSTRAVLTVGKTLREDIIRELPELASKVHVIYNVLDFTRFRPVDDRTNLLHDLQWAPGKQHVLCVANIRYEKGIDVLLEAAKTFDKDHVQFHLIGNVPGDRYSNRMVGEIRRRLNITLYPPVPHSDITTYYQACDVTVLPSRREGFGLSVAEAIACGKPVVATKSGGPEDIVNDDNGILVEIESPGQLAEGIRQVLSGSFAHKPQNIRQSIRHKFDSRSVLNRLFTIYHDVLNRRNVGESSLDLPM